MNFQVLLSCMFQDDFDIIEKSNLTNVSTLIINQCAKDNVVSYSKKHVIINSRTRGLSVSRNIAIKNSNADVCLLSDDDEVFIDDLENVILNAYEQFKQADVIIFDFKDRKKRLGNKPRRLRKYEMLKISSWQISFKLKSIKDKIFFDTKLGAGTNNGACEENKFLLDCYKNGLKIFYNPVEIGFVKQDVSTWFNGYNDIYFYNRGKTTRYILGLVLSIIYGIYFVFMKRKLYKNTITMKDAFVNLFKGIMSNSIK